MKNYLAGIFGGIALMTNIAIATEVDINATKVRTTLATPKPTPTCTPTPTPKPSCNKETKPVNTDNMTFTENPTDVNQSYIIGGSSCAVNCIFPSEIEFVGKGPTDIENAICHITEVDSNPGIEGSTLNTTSKYIPIFNGDIYVIALNPNYIELVEENPTDKDAPTDGPNINLVATENED